MRLVVVEMMWSWCGDGRQLLYYLTDNKRFHATTLFVCLFVCLICSSQRLATVPLVRTDPHDVEIGWNNCLKN